MQLILSYVPLCRQAKIAIIKNAIFWLQSGD